MLHGVEQSETVDELAKPPGEPGLASSSTIFHMTSLIRACLTIQMESYQSDICCFRAMSLSPLHLVVNWPVFGQPFVKRFGLCYQTIICMSCL